MLHQFWTQAQAHSHYEHKLAYGQGKFEDEKSLATTGSERDGECLPEFLLNAPRKLKIVIVLSTALFIGAVVLIGVGAAVGVGDGFAVGVLGQNRRVGNLAGLGQTLHAARPTSLGQKRRVGKLAAIT